MEYVSIFVVAVVGFLIGVVVGVTSPCGCEDVYPATIEDLTIAYDEGYNDATRVAHANAPNEDSCV